MKTAISLPDTLFETAENVAGRLGMSRSQLYQLALAAYLKQHEDEIITEELNEVYDGEDRGCLDPFLEGLQRGSLVKEDW